MKDYHPSKQSPTTLEKRIQSITSKRREVQMMQGTTMSFTQHSRNTNKRT